MKSDFLIAITQLAAERNLPREMVVSAVEAALVSAYKKDSTTAGQNIKVRLDPNTGDVSIFQMKTVVSEVNDTMTELTVKEAKKEAKKLGLLKEPQLEDILEYEMPAQVAGRIAAQTAKQVVIQRLREAEREIIFSEFSEREGEVLTATVQRSDARFGGPVTMDLNGRAECIIPPQEQATFERYRPGTKMKVLILEVTRTNRGPEIAVSRTHPDLLRRLFEMEVPEIFNGIVEIRAVAREPGSRSKVAVVAKQEGVDPVGACVGLRGIRIQNIVNELQGEKIDVVQWYRDPAVFISHALSPAQPLRVELDETNGSAVVIVSDRSLSLAIGRDGQNARLAAKLTNWKVDIKSSTELEIAKMKEAIEGEVAERQAESDAATAVLELETQSELEQPADQDSLEIPETVETRVEAEAEAEEIAVEEKPKSEETVEAIAETLAPAGEITIEQTSTSKLSAEEELALQSLEDLVSSEEEMQEEVVVLEEVNADEEDIWKVPETISGGPQIRFAEDILGAPVGGRRAVPGRTRRKGSRTSNRRPPGADNTSRQAGSNTRGRTHGGRSGSDSEG